MSSEDCNKTSSCEACNEQGTCSEKTKEAHEQQRIAAAMAQVKHKFLVLSGKGGVGKSSVAVNLAITLAQQGFQVGIMDADIHGPNIPKMLGVEEQRLVGSQDGLVPIAAPGGIKLMSVAFLLRSKDDAVIWRGPLKHSLIKQFLGEVLWGPLDYLVVDLPPGTGDEALSTAHVMKNVDGAVIVTTPQDVALLDSRKSVTFCRQLNIPLIGVVENMSGFTCPHCGKDVDLFKMGGGEKISREMNVPFLGRIPLDPEMVVSSDDGTPFVAKNPDSATTQAFHRVAEEWTNLLNATTERKLAQNAP
jgi:Mrp family chromosome partitioning ATPase